MEIVFITVLGLVIGSFLNVCIFRIPEEESISYPPSHCGNCGHKLYAKDLIPVLSYIFLGGKCRYCKNAISIQYPVIELLNGIIYLLFALKYGMTITTLKYSIMASLLIVIGIIDLRTQYVYSNVIITGIIFAVSFIVAEALLNNSSVLNYIAGGIIGAAIIALIVFLTHGMGEGDIEIAFVCGLFLGIKGIILALFLSIVIGGCIGIIIIIMKLKKLKDKIAFGPSLAMGALITAFVGNEILNAYMSLF